MHASWRWAVPRPRPQLSPRSSDACWIHVKADPLVTPAPLAPWGGRQSWLGNGQSSNFVGPESLPHLITYQRDDGKPTAAYQLAPLSISQADAGIWHGPHADIVQRNSPVSSPILMLRAKTPARLGHIRSVAAHGLTPQFEP